MHHRKEFKYKVYVCGIGLVWAGALRSPYLGLSLVKIHLSFFVCILAL